ncbi:MAG TPA: dihydrodipicolinate synthase family protein [Burkholderiales bacterium]|nr:dihydrodipicolinate synthase family protein [Burkholderiales bacterium]
MPKFQAGLVHMPVTPFQRDLKVDFGLFERIIAFHLDNGAQALALPMHVGESVSLSDAEQRQLLDFTIKAVKGRVPVIAHTSDAGTRIAAQRARHAQEIGAAAIIATTPYYWTPPPDMLIEHLATIAGAVTLPFFVFHTPDELAATKLNPDIVTRLMRRCPNFAGLVDASHQWQFMIDTISAAWNVRADFQLLSGSDYMVSAGTIGATGMFSSLAGVAPRLVRRLYDVCRTEEYFKARKPQEDIGALSHAIVRTNNRMGALKAAMHRMGRDCGEPRPPLEALNAGQRKALTAELDAMIFLREEPRGW